MKRRPIDITITANVKREDLTDESGVAMTFGIHKSEWHHFVRDSLNSVVHFSHDVGTHCLGCLATEWTSVHVAMRKEGAFEKNLIGMAQLALGLHMMHTGKMPEYGNQRVDLHAIERYFAHDQDTEYSGSAKKFDLAEVISKHLH